MKEYCPNCGSKLRDWFVFCEKCGFKLSQSAELKFETIDEHSDKYILKQSQYTDKPNFRTPVVQTQKVTSVFEEILQYIESNFNPKFIKDKGDFKNQLIVFLKTKFSNEIASGGHTSIGGEVDIVIDGTFAIRIKIIKNEGGLIFLVDQMIEYKRDFNKSAVILLDIGEVTTNKIEEYIDEYREMGIQTIIKKAWIKKDELENEQTVTSSLR